MSEHILIIEDDIDIANIERDYLMVAGYDVTVMNNGTDGIEAALNTPVDLIILDVMLTLSSLMLCCQKWTALKCVAPFVIKCAYQS